MSILTRSINLAGDKGSYGHASLTVHDRDADVDASIAPFTVSGLGLKRWRLRLFIDSAPARGKGPAFATLADTVSDARSVTLTQPYAYVRVKDIEGKVGGTLTVRVTLERRDSSRWTTIASGQTVVTYDAPAAVQIDLPLGMNIHPFSAQAPAEFWRPALDAVVAAGAGWVRFGLPWCYIENGGKGVRDPNMLAMLDTVMSDCGARGLKVLFIAAGATPGWASSQPHTAWTYKPVTWYGAPGYPPVAPTWQASGTIVNGQLPPDNWQDYTDHVTWLVNRYANGGLAGAGGTVLGAVECMNEPYAQTPQTRDGGSTGAMLGTPVATLAAWQAHLYDAVKAAKPDLTVVGLVAAFNDWALLQRLYDTGQFKGKYDALSVHPYPATFKAPYQQKSHTPRFPFGDASGEWHHHPASLGYFIDVMNANGDAAAVWVTEFGQSSGDTSSGHLNVSLTEQADHCAYMWRLLPRYQRVKAVFMHSVEDKGSNSYMAKAPTAWANFGIVGVDHVSRKPSFAAVKAVIAQIRAGTA